MFLINPVFQKELKQNARTKKTIVMIVLYNLLLALFGLFAFYLTFEGANKSGTSVKYTDILTIYAIVTGIEFLLVLFITPSITAGSISGEREKQTFDMLIASKLSSWQIVKGKLLASIALLMMLAISSLPILALVFSIGGITIINLMQFMLMIIVTALFIGSIGILFSSICKRTTVATVCTYIVLLVIFLGMTMILMGQRAVGVISGIRDGMRVANMSVLGNDNDLFAILIINPLFSFGSMLHDQTGFLAGSFNEWNTKNAVIYFIYQHWFAVSMVTQLAISGILLRISSRVIRTNRK